MLILANAPPLAETRKTIQVVTKENEERKTKENEEKNKIREEKRKDQKGTMNVAKTTQIDLSILSSAVQVSHAKMK